MAVNEADYTSVIVWTVGPEERQRRCEVGVVMRRWCCSTHTGNKVSSCVGGVVECVYFAFVEAAWFLWDCLLAFSGLRWPVNTSFRMGLLEAQGGVIVGKV